jgi:hypothetical protein
LIFFGKGLLIGEEGIITDGKGGMEEDMLSWVEISSRLLER